MAKAIKRLGMDSIAAEINSVFGTNTMVLASKAVGLVKPRFSTGSFALDILTGGGSPEGSIELLLGESGSAKSLGLLKRAAAFLNKHKNGVFVLINAEKTNDAPFLELNGVDVSRTHFIEPDSGEQAWDVIHTIAKSAEKVYIGIDSLDTMVPLIELDADMDEHKVAPAARQNNKGFRKLINAMKSDITTTEHRVTVGIIAQVRTNIGQMFGDPNNMVGGKGAIYAAMQVLKCRKVKDLRTEGKSLIDKSCYGAVYEVKVQKSKGRGQGETIQYTYYKENYKGFKRGQIDNVSELIPFALRHGLIVQSGAWFNYVDSNDKDQKAQGQDKLITQIASDPNTLQYLMDEVQILEEKRHEQQKADPSDKAPKIKEVKAPEKTKRKKIKRA